MRLIIFDFDGTLVNSQDMIITAYQNAAQIQRLPKPEKSVILKTIGLSLKESIEKIFPDLSEEEVKHLKHHFQTSFLNIRDSDSVQSLSHVYPGAIPFLENLSKCSKNVLAIASGKAFAGLRFDLNLHKLGRFFSNIQSSDSHPSKPDPSMLRACLSETGIKPSNAIMVGDTAYDIQMANSVSVKSIAVTWGYHSLRLLEKEKPDFIANSFEEVEKFIYQAID